MDYYTIMKMNKLDKLQNAQKRATEIDEIDRQWENLFLVFKKEQRVVKLFNAIPLCDFFKLYSFFLFFYLFIYLFI